MSAKSIYEKPPSAQMCGLVSRERPTTNSPIITLNFCQQFWKLLRWPPYYKATSATAFPQLIFREAMADPAFEAEERILHCARQYACLVAAFQYADAEFKQRFRVQMDDFLEQGGE
ncbi:hypothetical protein, partial [Bradyrhizobium sp. SUTN9-2]|uniref:hypothetical protein n=1 Tax=Bradyrhizobium sp. SUTN9-2 TaxID=1167456 RepID=UPI00195B093B